MGGISYKLFSHSQAFKKTVSEEDEETQTPHMSRTQTPRQTDRQAAPHPHPATRDPLPRIDLASLSVYTPGEGGGVAIGRRSSSRTLDPYPGYQTNQDSGKEGLRREEGLCIFLYLWQTAVLAWFQLPMEASTSQPAQNPQGARGATHSREQPAYPPRAPQGRPEPASSQSLSILLGAGVLSFQAKRGLQDHTVSKHGPSLWLRFIPKQHSLC